MPTAAQPPITRDDKVVFLLSYLSNLASYQTGPNLDHRLYISVTSGLVTTGTPWSVVWGPAVLQYPADGYALNAMYVASPIGQPTRFVIAIAGTNGASLLDWFLEDFNVAVQIPWNAPPTAGSPAIALATATGLSILLTMTPSAGLPAAGLTLPQFLGLATQGSSLLQVETTGHSLGGTLSPALGLWLSDHQGTATGWDPHGLAQVSSMPTAGATPGNLDFAGYYDDRLGPRTRRFVNTLDVIPHAWYLETLHQLPTLYAPAIPESPGVDFLVEAAVAAAKKGNYGPIVPDAASISGSLNPSIIHPSASAMSNYLNQMGYQHTTAYYLAFDLPATVIPSAPLAMPPPPADTRSQRATLAVPGKRMIAVGSTMIEGPRGPDDPRAAEVIAALTQVLADAAVVRPERWAQTKRDIRRAYSPPAPRLPHPPSLPAPRPPRPGRRPRPGRP